MESMELLQAVVAAAVAAAVFDDAVPVDAAAVAVADFVADHAASASSSFAGVVDVPASVAVAVPVDSIADLPLNAAAPSAADSDPFARTLSFLVLLGYVVGVAIAVLVAIAAAAVVVVFVDVDVVVVVAAAAVDACPWVQKPGLAVLLVPFAAVAPFAASKYPRKGQGLLQKHAEALAQRSGTDRAESPA